MFEFRESAIEGGIIVLALSGRLDALTALELRPTIDRLVEQKKSKVVVDMANLTNIDSSGVGALVSLFKRSRMLGGDVKIANLQGKPLQIFQLLRLDRAFDIFDTVEQAAARFR
ncbi:MAG: STAS domain-containing protein [Deltaproteobacteria bacterium]|nr:STAS domain-containing protein [Deltaproteobacteria bacterium]